MAKTMEYLGNSGKLVSFITSVQIYQWILLIFGGLCAWILLERRRGPRGPLPPGPPALPLVGSLPFLGCWDVRVALQRLALKYGDVMTLHLGPTRAVVLSSVEAIREAFITQGNSFSARPANYIVEKYMTRGWGIVETNGELWQTHRRFTLSTLRNFGMGKAMMEDRILEEVRHLLDAFKTNSSSPFFPKQLLDKATLNVILSVIAGERWDYSDPALNFHVETLQMSFESAVTNGLLLIFPSLIYLPKDFFGFWEVERRIRRTKDVERELVRQHELTYDPNVTRDLVDVYLHELKKRENLVDSFHLDQMLGVIGDLIGAGTETSSTSLTWAILFMMQHPKVQAKVQAEIDDVIGPNRLPAMKDRLHMPYTTATLLEIQRLGTVAPLGVPHETTEDVTLKGHFIPAGTTVLSCLYSVHMNPDLYPNPEKFDPNRFLDEQGSGDSQVNRKENLMPFSVGKRACVGESLAKMELFLLFSSLMQRFHFSSPPGCPLPALEGKLGATFAPLPYNVVVNERI